MNNRITMNSKSLQKHFPQVYGDFFSKCPVVVSAPGKILWAGEYTCQQGGIAITNHIPLRIFIGLELSKSKNSYGNCLYFDPDTNNFIKFDENAYFPSELVLEYLEKFNNRFKNLSKFTIHIISEVRPGSSSGFSPGFATALSVGINLYFSNLKSDDIDKITDGKINDFYKDSRYFDLLKLGHKLLSIYHGGCAGNATPWALLKYGYPLIEFHEKRFGQLNDSDTPIPANIHPEYDCIDKIDYYFSRLNDLLNIDKNPLDSIDYCLIYTGREYRSDELQRTTNNYELDTNNLVNQILRQIKSDMTDKFINKSLYKTDFIENNFRIWEKYIQFLGYISLEVIAGFYQTSLTGDAQQIISTIKKYSRFFPLLRHDIIRTNELCVELERKVKDEFNYSIVAKPLGAGGGGDILAIFPSWVLRDKISEIINYLQGRFDKKIKLDYASWLDGIEEEGVKIEQHLEEGIRSKFISQGSVSFKKYHFEGFASELSTLEKLEKEKSHIDLLIDLVEEKIYIKGEKLTSKQLHSTSATIEVLQVLLENIGKNIASASLPESAYNHDRNEMQSKIISPLKKIIKSKTKKELPLSLSGNLVDFYLKLEPSELDIRIIEKVF
ncbi:MAG: hypothetical protein ACD_58C00297G0005 [uncultured bacterium]|nr:MAG: hypothetical protein ACD_58C00297G0005 [uncultured bacterium]